MMSWFKGKILATMLIVKKELKSKKEKEEIFE